MSSRDRTIVSILLLVVIAVGGYLLVVKPQRDQHGQLQTQIAQARSQLVQVQAQVQSGLLAERRYRSYAGELRSLSVAVPVDEQIPTLINTLQSTSHHDGVGFQMIATSAASAAPTTPAAPAASANLPATPGATTVPASFPSQAFSFSFTGSYFAVADLLGSVTSYVRALNHHIRATHRLITIASVNLTPGLAIPTDAPAGNGPVTAQLTATDYYIPSAAIAGATATPIGRQ